MSANLNFNHIKNVSQPDSEENQGERVEGATEINMMSLPAENNLNSTAIQIARSNASDTMG